MHGYGEFYWPDGKKYFGNYKDDKKQGFGAFIWNINPKIKAYFGFWDDGKQDGVGIMITSKGIKYGYWYQGVRQRWFQAVWEMKKFAKAYHLKYLKFFEKETQDIINLFIKE
jgi:hypothetical protein